MKILKKIYFRSFLLQAVWSYERMQNIGFLYSMLPTLRSLYGDNVEKLKESCRRHVGYFNTHPYMAPFIIGYTAKQEEMIKEGMENAEEDLLRHKIQMAGPLAAIGDKMFWAIWRPLIGLMGVLAVLAGIRPFYAVPLGFLILYNVPILMHKYAVLKVGYYEMSRIPEGIKKASDNIVFRIFPGIGILLILSCVIIVFMHHGIFKGILFALVTAASAVLRNTCKLSATKLFYLLTGVIIIGNLIF